MRSEDDLLIPGEQIVLRSHPHWWYFVREVLGGVVLAAVLVLGVSLFDGTTQQVLVSLVGVAALVWLVWAGVRFVTWRHTEFIVTTHRVSYRSGFLHRTGVAIPLERISNLNFRQSFVERLFRSGDILIESASEGGMTTFDNVPDPAAVQRTIYVQIEAAGAGRGPVVPAAHEHTMPQTVVPSAPPADGEAGPGALAAVAGAPGPTGTVASQIEHLGRLREQGLLTPEEFERAKRELLDRI